MYCNCLHTPTTINGRVMVELSHHETTQGFLELPEQLHENIVDTQYSVELLCSWSWILNFSDSKTSSHIRDVIEQYITKWTIHEEIVHRDKANNLLQVIIQLM